MASIIERGPFQFQALVRLKGYPTQTTIFASKREAKAWANVIESEMVRGVFTDRREAEQTTLGEALEYVAGMPRVWNSIPTCRMSQSPPNPGNHLSRPLVRLKLTTRKRSICLLLLVNL